MGETAKALGQPSSFEFEGVSYAISPPEYRYMGEFEVFLESKALAKIERQKGTVDDATYKSRHEAMVAKVGSGAFERGQPEFQKALESFDGLQELMWILMRPVNPGLTRDVVARMFGVCYAEMMSRVELAVKQARDPVPNSATGTAASQPPSSPSAQSSVIPPGDSASKPLAG